MTVVTSMLLFIVIIQYGKKYLFKICAFRLILCEYSTKSIVQFCHTISPMHLKLQVTASSANNSPY